MKKLFTVYMLIFVIGMHSQDKRFAFSLRTEFADKDTHNSSYDYGFNIGAKIEYQMTITYFNMEIYHFPGLNDIDYTHVQGTILGFNHHSWDETWRLHIGLIKPGFIFREGPHVMFGQDIGIEHYFNNNLYIGTSGGYDIKTDSKLWKKDKHTVWYTTVKFGFYW